MSAGHIKVPDPTHDQCTNNATVDLGDGLTGVAAWYPQMGGYVSHCVIVPQPGGCMDVYVWHDGDFPFAPDHYGIENPAEPRRLHHCDGQQFIDLGELLVRLEGAQGTELPS